MKCTFCSKHVSNIFPEDFHEGIYLCKRCIRWLKKEFRKEQLESSSEVDQKIKVTLLKIKMTLHQDKGPEACSDSRSSQPTSLEPS